MIAARSIGVTCFLLGLYIVGFWPVAWSAIGIVLIAGGVAVFFDLDVVFWYRTRRKRPVHPGQVHVVLDDEGIHTAGDFSASDVRWQAIDRVIENKELWIIAMGTSVIKYIPKARLAPQQRAELADFLRRSPAIFIPSSSVTVCRTSWTCPWGS
jgi:hypothetical protein